MDIGGAVKAMKRGQLVQPTGKTKGFEFVFCYSRAEKAILIVEIERLRYNIEIEEVSREEALRGLYTNGRRVVAAVLMVADLSMEEVLGRWKIVPWPSQTKKVER